MLFCDTRAWHSSHGDNGNARLRFFTACSGGEKGAAGTPKGDEAQKSDF